MKKVALINPGKNQEFADNEPLNLGYLAAYLGSHQIDVKIIDQLAGDDVKLELKEYKPDFVGITATTPLVSDAYEILTYARQHGYTTIIGGVHASVLPQEASEHADFVVIGEGESALLNIVQGFQKEKIVRGTLVKNIDDIPCPARHLMKLNFYVSKRNRLPTAHLYFLSRQMRLASMITSRGCPYHCIFCHNSWRGVPVRYNSADRVINEIMYLRENCGVDAIFFMDDDLFVNRTRLKSICEAIYANKIRIAWSANARVSSVDLEILKIAKKAGCRQINFGIESGSQRILDMLEKKTTVEQGETAIKLANAMGLLVYATFMIGNPTETWQDIDLTRKFILRNRIDSIGIGITTPYPGTKLWEWCQKHNLIPPSYSWRDFNMESCPIPANENFSKDEIERIKSKTVFDCTLRQNPKLLWFYLKGVLYYPRELISKFYRVTIPLFTKRSG